METVRKQLKIGLAGQASYNLYRKTRIVGGVHRTPTGFSHNLRGAPNKSELRISNHEPRTVHSLQNPVVVQFGGIVVGARHAVPDGIARIGWQGQGTTCRAPTTPRMKL